MKSRFIKITGEKAKDFLQGQLTCDLNLVTESHLSLGAHCNNKGRVLFNFWLYFDGSDYWMQLPSEMVALAIERLKKFAVFSKSVISSPECSPDVAQRAECGKLIPWILPETSGLFTPHELNLPALNAVSFDKGCYIGQEIVARMHYRGKLKQHLYLADFHTSITPHPGDKIFLPDSNDEIGVIVNVYAENENQYKILGVFKDEYWRPGKLEVQNGFIQM